MAHLQEAIWGSISHHWIKKSHRIYKIYFQNNYKIQQRKQEDLKDHPEFLPFRCPMPPNRICRKYKRNFQPHHLRLHRTVKDKHISALEDLHEYSIKTTDSNIREANNITILWDTPIHIDKDRKEKRCNAPWHSNTI